MPTIQCLHCAQQTYLDDETYANYQGQVTCESCKGQQSVVFQSGALQTATQAADIYGPIRDVLAYDVPPTILADLAEAASDLSGACYKSCVVMCRRVLHAVLLQQGIEDAILAQMIDTALERKLLTERLYATVQAIRFFGNAGAHPRDEDLNAVEQLDATLALQVTKRYLQASFKLKPPPPPVADVDVPADA